MHAWHVQAPGPVDGRPLRLHTEDDLPRPGPVRRQVPLGHVQVGPAYAAGQDLEQQLARPGVTPGHEVVGEVAAVGEGADGSGPADGFAVGDRAGAAWLRWTDNTCKFCLRDTENLCPNSLYTGWDADGGYAEYMTVPAAYAHRLPEGYSDPELAPLLCAGIIGYHALPPKP